MMVTSITCDISSISIARNVYVMRNENLGFHLLDKVVFCPKECLFITYLRYFTLPGFLCTSTLAFSGISWGTCKPSTT